ncbi:hypothetical protein Theco_1905 [Thermobacillus composti KWC4]|uniref:Uncharacterized protein n=1 Tax=Thermobacillus composti (strain DSM 18247 / JCM 13945 / KWC4) TaxID=717605 RepID=L0EFV7_THECK|nr:hypothetical protein Theco_1905 [Thermobacillus composti KWC4]
MRTIVRTQGASVTARLGFGRILFSTRRGRNGTLFTDVPRRRLPEAAHALSGGAHDEPDAAGSGFAAAYAHARIYRSFTVRTVCARSWPNRCKPAIRTCPNRLTIGRRRSPNSPCEKKYNPCCLNAVALLPASFSHPDCYCRLRNCTGSTVPPSGQCAIRFRPGSRADAGSAAFRRTWNRDHRR